MLDAASLNILMPILLLVLFYFMLIRPQKKRDQQLKSMRNSLKKGDHITTIGGIHGKITKVTENTVTIVTSEEKTKLVFEKWAVGRVVPVETETVETEETEEAVVDEQITTEEIESQEVEQENIEAEETEETEEK